MLEKHVDQTRSLDFKYIYIYNMLYVYIIKIFREVKKNPFNY